jgi:uncharacterized protein YcbK (DUF882 family)
MPGRRAVLAAALACGAVPAAAQLASAEPRRIALAAIHTGERFDGIYWHDGAHDPEAMVAIAWLLRDRAENRAGAIDPALIDTLWLLDRRIPGRGFEVASGYRTPRSQAALAARWGRAAASSLHVEGRAVDVRRPGLHALGLVGAAWQLGRGGVGLYRGASPFVHLDTGPRRRW